MPVAKCALHGLNPFTNAGLPSVDLLASADKANNHRPIFAAIHAGNQELWLRYIEACDSLLAAHKRGRLFLIPCALSLIKQRYMIDRRTRLIKEAFIPKMVHVLDERLHPCHGVAFPESSSLHTLASNGVSRQSFAEDCYEGAIARKKHTMKFALGVVILRRNVKPYKRFPGTRHSGNETNGLLAQGLRRFNDSH